MRRAAGPFSFVLAVSLACLAHPASAQDGIFTNMQKGVESVFSTVSTTTTLASGQVIKTDTTNVYPAFNLNLDTLLLPSLRLNTGGVFEVNMFDVKGTGIDATSTITRNRPFFLLRSTNPVFSPGFGYFRREDRNRTAGVSNIKLVNDEYAGYLGWNIEGGPHSDFQFLRDHTFDGDRLFQDVYKDFGTVVSNYTYRNFGAYYLGSYLDTNDHLRALDTRQVSHAGRVYYSDAFLRKRLVWNATYNVNYQNIETVASGKGGEVAIPVTPFAGMAAVSETPVTAKLTQNAALIDGNLTAGAGVDLGLPATLADAQSRNIGLDFLNPAQVNRFLIWVDRDLPVEVTNSFSWEIYSSTDNVVWKREAVVSGAPFGPFENRFELDFPAITARYMKVVTRPFSSVVPAASRFPDILVTEMQAFLTRPAGQANSKLTQTTHLVNTDVRMRLLDAPSLFYEGFYLYNGPDTFGTGTNTLSNGLSINHTFGRIFSAYGRAAREQGTQPEGHRVATVTNATLTADPIPRLRTSLLYAGLDERIAGVPANRRGFFVQNAGQPYRGIDLVFGFGWNFTSRETGEIAHDRLVNATATIVPRQHVSLTFSYDDTSTNRSGAFIGEPRLQSRRAYAAVAVDPISTLHLVLGEEVLVLTGQRTRTTLDVSANWSPFPDGTLQFIFASNDYVRDIEFGNDRSTLGAVRWNWSRRSFIDVSYQRTRSEFVFQTTESKIFNTTVRLFF